MSHGVTHCIGYVLVNIMLCQSPWSDWGMGTTAL